MTPEIFEEQWHGKRVRPKLAYYEIPDTTYVVTAALYQYESDNETIFAIRSERYTLENKEWYTIRMGKDEFEARIADFEIIS